MKTGYDITHFQSQRDCVLQPRVARNELPWEIVPRCTNPERVAALPRLQEQGNTGHNPFRVDFAPRLPTQGSSFLATLGCVPESLRDSSAHPREKMRVGCTEDGRTTLNTCMPGALRILRGGTPCLGRRRHKSGGVLIVTLLLASIL